MLMEAAGGADRRRVARSRHLRATCDVPPHSHAVAAASHAPCRSRVRRHHGYPVPSGRDDPVDGDQARGDRGARSTGHGSARVRDPAERDGAVQPFEHPAAARSRPRVAARRGDAGHAPGSSFDRAAGDEFQLRLLHAGVGPPVRDLSRPAGGRPRSHDDRNPGVPRSGRVADRQAARATAARGELARGSFTWVGSHSIGCAVEVGSRSA